MLTREDRQIMIRLMSVQAQSRYHAADRQDAFKMRMCATLAERFEVRAAVVRIANELRLPLHVAQARWAAGMSADQSAAVYS